jgi:hypothetical protein
VATPTERRRLLSELNRVAASDLFQVWRSAGLADVDFAQFITDAFPEIASDYAEVAGNLAADWYEQAAPQLPYQAIVDSGVNTTALTKSAQWALGADGDMALNRLSGTLQRTVFDGARSTTVANVRNEEGARWARYASANACEFCALMAIRGAVYGSEETAGAQYHDNCHCLAVEVRPGRNYEPAPHVKDWEDQYKTARRDAESGGMKAILAAWRQLDD